MGVAVFGEGEGGEGGGAGYAGVRVAAPGAVAAEADCRQCLGVVAACFSVWRFLSGLILTSTVETDVVTFVWRFRSPWWIRR